MQVIKIMEVGWSEYEKVELFFQIFNKSKIILK